MNNLDKTYTDLLQDILDNGVTKSDRTGTGTISIFGRQIRHKMSDGFPLLTTKKMAWKTMVVELLWFLRGDTNIKFLHDNDCHIWDGDYAKSGRIDGELGPIYGKQWRNWAKFSEKVYTREIREIPEGGRFAETRNVNWVGGSEVMYIDQIANLINDLKTNPDSRRLMVSSWNCSELDQMVLPPCHYGFQVYTRELSASERQTILEQTSPMYYMDQQFGGEDIFTRNNIPTRAISLMFNMRSVDTFLGLPFNIASYGLLLEIIAKAVNMVPDELIGNLGDVHLYSNHIEQAKEQIGRDLTLEERRAMVTQEMFNQIYNGGGPDSLSHSEIDQWGIPRRTREPFPLPTLNINTEWWPREGGECGVGPLDAVAIFNSFKNNDFCRCLLEEDIQLGNYQSHPSIKAPLSN